MLSRMDGTRSVPATLLARCLLLVGLALGLASSSGCMAFPDFMHQPTYHNPFPQLHKVAVLPFYNQSSEPTVDGEKIANMYYQELQGIPGFEVMPVGVARQAMLAMNVQPRSPQEFQKLAQVLNVDAVIVGSVTDYTPYYPPKMGLAVDWYAANPGFHEIPAGYGLPWNTPAEEFIPSQLVQEAEFALAREQLKTQTPDMPPIVLPEPLPLEEREVKALDHQVPVGRASQPVIEPNADGLGSPSYDKPPAAVLPPNWPDPSGFVPKPPRPEKPPLIPNAGPIMTHTRIYDGSDNEFTQRLSSYYYFRDDARFGGWQSYLQRPDDFAKFCCHLHLTETLAARGGAGESRVVWRWPINRYER